MLELNNYFYENGPGLWYDRRRDDHTYQKRNDSYVWAPFYELPWMRTGYGKAWDGGSLYDLEKFNSWYFLRIKALAEECDKKGIMVYHSLFNTHNLLEIAPHWCDYPARSANCINLTDLPEPMPIEPKGRLHIANEYYSVQDSSLIRLHHLYINRVLDELGYNSNICFCVGFQYVGPLSFLKFFHETVSEWERKHKRKIKLLLRTSKAFTDSILANPKYAAQVKVIDTRYWQYLPTGTLFAPKAGINRAYREMIGAMFHGYGGPMPVTTPFQVYRQIREYTDKYPDKAVIGWKNQENVLPLLMAGAAQVVYRNPTAGHGQRLCVGNSFDLFFNKYLSDIYYKLKPVDSYVKEETLNWAMCSLDQTLLALYSLENAVLVPLFDGKYDALWYQPEAGIIKEVKSLIIHKEEKIHKPDNRNWFLLLKRQ